MRCRCREKGIGNPPSKDGECLICRRRTDEEPSPKRDKPVAIRHF